MKSPEQPTEVVALRREFPGWNIWFSDGGHCYASRREDLSDRAREQGLFMTVDGPDLLALHDELEIQAQREERAVALLGSLV